MAKFKPIQSQVDFVALEKELLDHWYKNRIVEKYLAKNKSSEKKFSFLDGPITANNPMGVHHAWGRTYKDLWQRFNNMQGNAERFQNGFDEQGLWVEVEVEKELGIKNKKEIEDLVHGDKFKSLEKFVTLCKERVKKFAEVQTEQSKRLGYFMDWDNSYHTSSEQNNYSIWHYLKSVQEKGWLYKGKDSVPWCPRCGTAISQHEIESEGYQEITHETVYASLPIHGRDGEFLLIWTTTPWTIPANVAVAVNPKEEYVAVKHDDKLLWLMQKRTEVLGDVEIIEKRRGTELLGWEYDAPFDDLPIVKKNFGDYIHQVIDGGEVVTETEGTGLLHVAPGAGTEDFKLGQEFHLPMIAPIEEDASYVKDMGFLAGKNAKVHPELIIDYLKEKNGGRFLFKTEKYKHRYPTCWRCKTELVWRVVDEWYIAMDKKAETGKRESESDKNASSFKLQSSSSTYREQMQEAARKINWMPKWGKERELDWLKNMHDWLISKKRYWGLALPIWVCEKCEHFQVIGSKEELKEKAVEGWDKFEGNSPHRPWIDQIKLQCPDCGGTAVRIPDVGNPWLDAGIVPFSTLPEGWFPADFVTESFPGQFKNWFYSLIAMSAALAQTNPFKNLLGYATVVDEKGQPMHKSTGNSIEFNDAANKMGVDPMRWLFATQNPENDLRFGFNTVNEVKRRFYLIFWNSYKFFVDYANLVDWSCDMPIENERLTVLDKWVLAKLTKLVLTVNASLQHYNAMDASRSIEDFVVSDLSTWYIRRSRGRLGPTADKKDEAVCLSVLYGVLVTLSKLVAPFMPFISETIYVNLTQDTSVHLTDFPQGDKSLLDEKLTVDMDLVRTIVEKGHAKRKEAGAKLRQPLAKATYNSKDRLEANLEQIIADELNVKSVDHQKGEENQVTVILDMKMTEELKKEGDARELIRAIQIARKEAGTNLDEYITVEVPSWPKEFEEEIKRQTLAKDLKFGKALRIERI